MALLWGSNLNLSCLSKPSCSESIYLKSVGSLAVSEATARHDWNIVYRAVKRQLTFKQIKSSTVQSFVSTISIRCWMLSWNGCRPPQPPWNLAAFLFDPFPANEPPHDKTNKMSYASSQDSDQRGHPPSLIRIFTIRLKKAWIFKSYRLRTQRRLWSAWADAQLIRVFAGHTSHFVGFVMRRLKWASSWDYGTYHLGD